MPGALEKSKITAVPLCDFVGCARYFSLLSRRVRCAVKVTETKNECHATRDGV
jgi:hypothetical protein